LEARHDTCHHQPDDRKHPPATCHHGAPRRRRGRCRLGIATLLLGVDLTVDMNNAQPAMTIGLGPVVVTALIASLDGWASLAGLERVTDKARGIWRVVAVAALLASFLPLLAAETDLAVTLTLGAMHVLVAAVLIPGPTASNERTNP